MDYYLKTTSKQDLIQDLQSIGIHVEFDTNYYQDEILIIDWIGQIPNPIEYDENGQPIGEITYKDGVYVNIRSVNELDVSKFIYTFDVYPDIPYRIFS